MIPLRKPSLNDVTITGSTIIDSTITGATIDDTTVFPDKITQVESNIFNTGTNATIAAGQYFNNDSSKDVALAATRDIRNVFWFNREFEVERLVVFKAAGSTQTFIIEDGAGVEVVRFVVNSSTPGLVGSAPFSTGSNLSLRTEYYLKNLATSVPNDMICQLSGKYVP